MRERQEHSISGYRPSAVLSDRTRNFKLRERQSIDYVPAQHSHAVLLDRTRNCRQRKRKVFNDEPPSPKGIPSEWGPSMQNFQPKTRKSSRNWLNKSCEEKILDDDD